MSNKSWRHIATIILPMLALFLVAGCGSSAPEHSEKKEQEPRAEANEHSPEEAGHDGEIRMTPAMALEAGITVEPITVHHVGAVISAPARVVPTQGGIAHVGTIIPGRIARILVAEGEYVRAGAALAEIEALDVGRLQGDYLTARAELERTQSTLSRQEKLSGEGIGAGRTLEEAKAAYAQAAAAVRADEAKLRAIGIDPSTLTSGRPFSSRIVLRSPIAGLVARRAVALGEYLEPDHDAFEVVNTAVVWIEAQLAPDVAASVRLGDAGFISEKNGRRHSGRICFISPTVDPASRTVTIRIETSNPDAALRPESFVTAEIETAAGSTVIAVPRGAVEQEGGASYLYREHEPNTFRRVPVRTGPQGGEYVSVMDGARAGDRIAVSGLFYLKSAREKESLVEDDD